MARIPYLGLSGASISPPVSRTVAELGRVLSQ